MCAIVFLFGAEGILNWIADKPAPIVLLFLGFCTSFPGHQDNAGVTIRQMLGVPGLLFEHLDEQHGERKAIRPRNGKLDWHVC